MVPASMVGVHFPEVPVSLPHLPIVVPGHSFDCDSALIDDFADAETASSVANHSFRLILEPMLLPREQAVATFGEALTSKLEKMLTGLGRKFGELPHGDKFLSRLSSLDLREGLKNQLRQWLDTADPTAINIALRSRLMDIDEEQANAIDTALAPTGLQRHMELHDIFIEALTPEAVKFYNLNLRSIGLSYDTADLLIFRCGVTEVLELYHAARTPGFPYYEEVEQAFANHGQSLKNDLQWAHFEQIYGLK